MSTKTKHNSKPKPPTNEQLLDVIEGLRNRVQELEHPTTNSQSVQLVRNPSPIEKKAREIDECTAAILEYTNKIVFLEQNLESARNCLSQCKVTKVELLRELDKLSV